MVLERLKKKTIDYRNGEGGESDRAKGVRYLG